MNATFKTDDMQEAFDIAYNGVVVQGKPSHNGRNCMYRLGELRCGIGHLITDATIGEMDDIVCSVDSIQLETSLPLEFLEALQGAHDAAHETSDQMHDVFISEFKECMGRIAKEFELTLPQEIKS